MLSVMNVLPLQRYLAASGAAMRGFSLIETAIVLGVIGLVIGGIWVAAASVQQNLKLNRLVSAVLRIEQQGRALFPVSSYPTAPFTRTDVTAAAVAAGIVPSDLMQGQYIAHGFGVISSAVPYQAEIKIYLFNDNSNNKYFHVFFEAIENAKSCTILLNALLSKFRSGELLEQWQSCHSGTCNGGWLPGSGLSQCPDNGGGNNITLYFKP